MEASATTENVQSKNHSHGPNFGRYVADCAACAVKYPDGPPSKVDRKAQRLAAQALRLEKRHEREARKQEEIAVKAREIVGAIPPLPPGTMSNEQMMLLLQQQQAQLMAFATEMRKPDPEIVAEREAAKARLIQSRKQNAEAAAIEIAQKERRQNSCSHTMPKGERAISGQAHSDGMFHPICVVCQKEFTPVKLTSEQMAMGVS